jgi:hypothetical protein
MAPAVVVVGFGVACVFVAMNVLAAAPVAVDTGPSPTPVASPSLPGSPSALPLASATELVSPFPTASLPDHGPTFVHSYVNESDPNGIWKVDLGYPSFVVGSTPWAAAIDSGLKDEEETMAQQWEAGPAANRQAPGKVNTLTGSFTKELLSPALASFTLTWVDDSSAAGPATSVETLNYDLSTGQQIVFNDLFRDPGAAIEVISTESQALLQVELGVSYDPTIAVKGTSAVPGNYLHWALTPAGMKITFDQGQVTSGNTTPSIVVPWSLLRSVMVATGPVASLAGV